MDDTAKNTEPETRTFEPKPPRLSDALGAGLGSHSETPETRAVPQPESGEAPAEKRRKESGG